MARELNIRLDVNTSPLEKGLARANSSLRRFAFRVDRVGRELTQNLTLPIAGVGALAVREFARFESATKALQATTREAGNLEEQLERLRRVAQLPGLGFQEAVQGSARLQAVGFSALQAEQIITQFGNAVARAGGGRAQFDGVILALTQIASKGRISAEEINQLNERIVDIRPAIQAAFGTTSAEELNRLGVSAGEFIARVTEELSKLERVEGGLANAFENFRDSLSQALVTVGEAINKSINLEELISRLADFVNALADRFSNLSPEVQRAVVVSAALAAAAGPLLVALGAIVKILPLVISGIKAFGVAGSAATGILAGLSFAFTDLVAEFDDVDMAIAFIEAKFAKLVAIARETASIIGEEFSRIGGAIVAALRGDLKGAAAFITDGLENDVLGRIQEAGDKAFEQSLFGFGLRQGLKDFKDSIEETAAEVDISAIFGDTSEIDGEVDRIVEATQKVNTALKETVPPSFPLDFQVAKDAVLSTADRFFGLVGRARELGFTLQEVAETGVTGIAGSLEDLGAKVEIVTPKAGAMKERFLELQETALRFSEQMATTVRDGVASFATGFAESLAAVATGSATVGQAFAGLLDTLLGVLERVGRLAIETGVALLGIQTALKTLNPFAAIAAGAALIAVTRIIRSGLKDAAQPFADGGLVTGPTFALVGEGPGTTRNNPEVIAPLDKLQGMIGGGGRGYIAEARISGRDLLLLLRDEEDAQARIR